MQSFLVTIRREFTGVRCRETFVELTALLSSSSRGAKTGLMSIGCEWRGDNLLGTIGGGAAFTTGARCTGGGLLWREEAVVCWLVCLGGDSSCSPLLRRLDGIFRSASALDAAGARHWLEYLDGGRGG
jgi:hypothetical protein